jgi:hypothetical protein
MGRSCAIAPFFDLDRLFDLDRHTRDVLRRPDRQRCLHASHIRSRRKRSREERLKFAQIVRDDLEDEINLAVEHVAFAHRFKLGDMFFKGPQIGFSLTFKANHRKHGDRES